ncbi:hypothetical protein J2S89_003295 [Arthrobacter bambusae]|nr:hypothetical protein [Arthrobacter bambusae]
MNPMDAIVRRTLEVKTFRPAEVTSIELTMVVVTDYNPAKSEIARVPQSLANILL